MRLICKGSRVKTKLFAAVFLSGAGAFFLTYGFGCYSQLAEASLLYLLVYILRMDTPSAKSLSCVLASCSYRANTFPRCTVYVSPRHLYPTKFYLLSFPSSSRRPSSVGYDSSLPTPSCFVRHRDSISQRLIFGLSHCIPSARHCHCCGRQIRR